MFFLPAVLSYNFLLIAAAIVPAAFLMFKTYKSDRLEKEPPAMLWKLVKAGAVSALIALAEECVLGLLLGLLLPKEHWLYPVILYFGVVACAEESAKYLMMKRRTWKSPEFNCRYDAVVYAVFVSLSFALWENIGYVLSYGIRIAIARALTAIPGHACFGVFMGVFYGAAKERDCLGNQSGAKQFRVLAVLIPVLLHGAYDYFASAENGSLHFVAFIAALFVVSYLLVGKKAKEDRRIQ